MISSHSLFAKSPTQTQLPTSPVKFTEELLDQIRGERNISRHLNLAGQPVGVNEVAALVEAINASHGPNSIESIDLTGCSPKDDNAIGVEGCQLLATWLRRWGGKS